MPNIAKVLKDEITRVARKEFRGETQASKKAAASSRSEIAKLKRRIAELEKIVKQLAKAAPRKTAAIVPTGPTESRNFRFSPTRLAAHRKRLDLTVAQMGYLLNTSSVSIYKWEHGQSRPRASYMPAIAALRTLSKAKAAAVLAAAAKP